MGPDDTCRATIEKIRSYAREAGRDPKSIGIEGRITIAGKSPEELQKEIDGWKNLGATHLAVNTMKGGLATPAAHVEAIRRFHDATAAIW